MVTDRPKRQRAIGYIRVSTKAQGQNGYGLDAQRDSIRKYCAANDLELLTVIPDVMSGSKAAKLHGRAAAVAAIRAGIADVLVLRALDRATRDTRDGLALMHEAQCEGWRVVTTKGEDTETLGQLELTIKLAFAQEERVRISQRTKDGMARAKRHGTKSGRPIGRASTIPAEVVGRIIELSGEGLGAKAIAKALEAESVPSPSGGVIWHYSTVRGVIARAAATSAGAA